MRIAIVVAMGKELELLLPLIEEQRRSDCGGQDVVFGRIGNHEIALMQCGIGKVNASIGAVELIDMYHPDLLINSGVAGGADPSMHVLDTFIAEGVAYHDVWCGPGTIYGQAAGCPQIFRTLVPEAVAGMVAEGRIRSGLICSGDKFITSESEIREIKSHFPEALAVDMESASIAHVCERKKVPFMILRVISDTPGQAENISQYENFWTDAPERTFELLSFIIKSM